MKFKPRINIGHQYDKTYANFDIIYFGFYHYRNIYSICFSILGINIDLDITKKNKNQVDYNDSLRRLWDNEYDEQWNKE